MPALRFIRGIEGFGPPEQEEASNQAVLDAFPSEFPASTENQTGPLQLPDDSVQGDSEAITFPDFAPDNALSEDEDVDLPQHSVPNTLPKKARIRFGLFPGLLLLLVVLQGVPSFLWLRQRFTASTPTVPPLNSATPAAVPLPAAVSTSGGAAPETTTTGASPSVVAPPGQPVASRREAAARPRAKASVSGASVPTTAELSAGRLSVTTPVSMQIYVKGKLVGITDAETILPVGNHDLEFISEAVGYRATRRVTVKAARTTKVRLNPPSGLLSVNASPWAEVWVDNQRIGETPIGNIRTPIGKREVIFRHPQFGERRVSALVTLKQPARVSLDLTQK